MSSTPSLLGVAPSGRHDGEGSLNSESSPTEMYFVYQVHPSQDSFKSLESGDKHSDTRAFSFKLDHGRKEAREREFRLEVTVRKRSKHKPVGSLCFLIKQ